MTPEGCDTEKVVSFEIDEEREKERERVCVREIER